MDKFYKVYSANFEYEEVRGYFKQDQISLALDLVTKYIERWPPDLFMDQIIIEEVVFGPTLSSIPFKTMLSINFEYKDRNYKENYTATKIFISGFLSKDFVIPDKFFHLEVIYK